MATLGHEHETIRVDNLKTTLQAFLDRFGGGGSGVLLNEPLSGINAAGLGTPSQANTGIVWNGLAWTYQVLGGGGGSGTVTSVGLAMPDGFTVTGTPVTGSGTLSVAFGGSVAANRVLASPNGASGVPSWRALVAADIPDLSSTYVLTSAIGDMATKTWVSQQGFATASNVYSKTDADSKFMTIEAFEHLFAPLNSSGNAVAHPYGSGVASIKALFGLWTEQYLSALGLNDSGGGGGVTLNEPLSSINSASLGTPTTAGQVITWNGTQWAYSIPGSGGSSTLAGLSDVAITNPSVGQVLKWDGTNWVNGTGGSSGGTVAWGDVTNKPTTISGYGITDAKILNGVITLGANSITPLTSSDISDMATKTWVGQQGFLTSVAFGDLTSHPTTLSGYGITDAYTKAEADAKYMTITAFENLFAPLNSNGNSVAHPYSSNVASIKALFGLWTEQYLSALGLSSSGGGGVILNEPLESINNAGLGTPSQSGVAIMWNGSAWTYQVPGGSGGGGGTVTSVGLTVPTGFSVSGSPVTGSGTLGLSFANGYSLPLTADVSKGVTAYNSLSNYLPLAGGTLALAGIGLFTVKNTVSDYPLIRFEGNTAGGIGFIGIGKTGNTVSPYYVTADANGGYTDGVSQWYTLLHTGNWTESITLSSLGAASASELNNYLPLSAGSGKPLTGSLYLSSLGKGVFVPYTVGGSTVNIPLIYDNGENLWIGATQTTGTHHVGATYISAGTGEVYISRLVSSTRTNYKVLDKGNTYVSSGKGYIDSSEITTISGNAGTASRLQGSGTYTAWGQTYWTSGVPQSILGDIRMLPSGGNTNSDSAKIDFRTLSGDDYVYAPYIQAINIAPYGLKRLSVFQKSQSDWTTAQTEVFTIWPTGTVGINTSSPNTNYKLDVNGYTKTSRLYLSDTIYMVVQNDGIHIVGGGLYADTYVSALGLSDGGSGSGGSVTSVGLTVPTGFSVGGSPVTTSGTLSISFANGYSLPTTAKQSNWDTAYGWGNHANVGYATPSSVAIQMQSYANIQNNTIHIGDNSITPLLVNNVNTLFTSLSSTNDTNLSITVGGTTKIVNGLYALRMKSANIVDATSGNAYGNLDNLDGSSYSVVTNYNSNTYWSNAPAFGSNYGGAIVVRGENDSLMGQLAWSAAHGTTNYPTQDLWWRARASGGWKSDWKRFAFRGESQYIDNSNYIYWKNNASSPIDILTIGLTSNNDLVIGYGVAGMGYNTYLDGNNVNIRYGTSRTSGIVLNSSGNVGIGTTSPSYKLHVAGDVFGNSLNTNSNLTSVSGGNIEGFHSIELNSKGSLSGYGGFIDFHFNGSSSDFTSRIIEDASGRIYLNASAGVRIGNAVLIYDSTNNALKVQHYQGGAANFYALGGVSALGMSGNTMGEVDGSLIPSVNGGYDLGSIYKGWAVLYLANDLGYRAEMYIDDTGDMVYDLYGGSNQTHCFEGKISVSGTAYLSGKVSIGGTNANGTKLYVSASSATELCAYFYGNASANTFTSRSDMRLKDFVENLTLGVDAIAEAPSFKYTFKGDSRLMVGTSAQYWRGVLNETVFADNDGMLSLDYGVTALASVISVARKVMTHEEEIASLKRRIGELENEIETLKAA